MEIRQLKTFISVAETGNMSLASKLCGLTQSAISQQIKAMEDELGMQLFVRNFRDVSLTEAGSLLLTHAKSILNESLLAKDEIASMQGKVYGSLNIGAGYAIEPYIRIAQLEMMRQYPDVQLNVQYAQSAALHEMLVNHKIDMAFTMNQSYPGEGIISTPCIPFRICAIMTKTHTLARQESVSMDDLRNHYVILPDVNDRAARTVEEKMGCDIHDLKIRAVVSSASAALNLIEDLNYITFLPCLYVNNRPSLTARPIRELSFDLISNVHQMRDTYVKSSAREFLRIIRDHAIPYYKCLSHH